MGRHSRRFQRGGQTLAGGREHDVPGGRWVDGKAERLSDREIANHFVEPTISTVPQSVARSPPLSAQRFSRILKARCRDYASDSIRELQLFRACRS